MYIITGKDTTIVSFVIVTISTTKRYPRLTRHSGYRRSKHRRFPVSDVKNIESDVVI